MFAIQTGAVLANDSQAEKGHTERTTAHGQRIGAVGERKHDEEDYGEYRYLGKAEMVIRDCIDEPLDRGAGNGEEQDDDADIDNESTEPADEPPRSGPRLPHGGVLSVWSHRTLVQIVEKQGWTARKGRCLPSEQVVHVAVHPRIEIDTMVANGIDHPTGRSRRQSE